MRSSSRHRTFKVPLLSSGRRLYSSSTLPPAFALPSDDTMKMTTIMRRASCVAVVVSITTTTRCSLALVLPGPHSSTVAHATPRPANRRPRRQRRDRDNAIVSWSQSSPSRRCTLPGPHPHPHLTLLREDDNNDATSDYPLVTSLSSSPSPYLAVPRPRLASPSPALIPLSLAFSNPLGPSAPPLDRDVFAMTPPTTTARSLRCRRRPRRPRPCLPWPSPEVSHIICVGGERVAAHTFP